MTQTTDGVNQNRAERAISRSDRITTAAIFVGALLYTLTALSFPGDAKIVPTILGSLALIVVSIQLIAPWTRAVQKFVGDLKLDEADRAIFTERAARWRLLQVSASLVATPFVVALVGLPIALPLYVAIFLLFQRVRIPLVIVYTAIIGLAAYGLLVLLLAWPIDEGLLWRSI